MLVGCTAAPRALDWKLSITDAELESRSVALEAIILDGTCSSAIVLHRSMTRLDEAQVTPPRLSPGMRSFRARLYDAGCAPIAEGCIQTSLPLADGAEVVVELRALGAAVAACAPAACDDGICRGPDVDGGGVDSSAARDSGIGWDSGVFDSSAADAARDSMEPVDTGPSCTPGLCQTCGAAGPEMPADDEACGVIDCDGLDAYFVEGSPSATGTNYRSLRDYVDLTTNRCAALGVCKAPNNAATCAAVSDRRIDSCGTCVRATESGCADYDVGTSCGSDARCYSGRCATACDTTNDGSVTCDTLCSWCGGTCRGAVTTAGGREVGCSVSVERMVCYCT